MTQIQKFKIERGVTVPPKAGGNFGPHKTKYPFREMKPGDSILVRNKALNQQGSLLACAKKQYASGGNGKHKAAFTTRQMDGGIRIWRVE